MAGVCFNYLGAINDQGYNIDDDGSCGFGTGPGSESASTTLDTTLGALQNNGVPTLHDLL
jgi:hypothetical protein